MIDDKTRFTNDPEVLLRFYEAFFTKPIKEIYGVRFITHPEPEKPEDDRGEHR